MMNERRSRYEALDSWRGIAALCVVVYHIYETPSHVAHLPLMMHGLWFVDYFFILSGFVISHAYFARLKAPGTLRSFVIQRIGRIYPLHAAMLALFIVTEFAKLLAVHAGLNFSEAPFTGRNTIFGIFTNLTLIHSFGFHPPDGSWNQPSWSIGVEFYTYLIFAALVLFARGSKIIFAALIALSALIIVNNPPFYLGDALILGIVRCVYGFVLGHFVWRLTEHLSADPRATAFMRRYAAPLEAAAILLVVVAVSAVGFEPLNVILPFVFCPVVLIFAFEAGPLSSLLKARLFRWLGMLSYSIYMTHAWVIWVLTILFAKLAPRLLHHPVADAPGLGFFGSNPWVGDGAILFAVGCVLVLSIFTYRFIEMPGRSYFRALAQRLEKADRERQAASAPAGRAVESETPSA
jgi:peptidoglycan/LPS O-acetylase OafA/YrhL